MDWGQFFSNLLSAVIGGLIAVAGAIVAVRQTDRLGRQAQQAAEAKTVVRLLQALLDEIEVLWSRYQSTTGTMLAPLPSGKAFKFKWGIYQDYFTIYHSNGLLLTRIKDDELRHSIINTYTKAKGFSDSFRMNNELFDKWFAADQGFQQTGDPTFGSAAQGYDVAMAQYAGALKQQHAELATDVDKLVRSLRAAIIGDHSLLI